MKKVYNLSKRALNSSVEKMVVMEGLEYSPKLYERETKTIKYKMICLALESDLTNCAVDKATRLARQRFLKYFANNILWKEI